MPCEYPWSTFVEMTTKLMIDIANYIYEHPTLLDLKLQGMWMADRKLYLSRF